MCIRDRGYGMTECSPVISTNLSWDIRKNSEMCIRDRSKAVAYYKEKAGRGAMSEAVRKYAMEYAKEYAKELSLIHI